MRLNKDTQAYNEGAHNRGPLKIPMIYASMQCACAVRLCGVPAWCGLWSVVVQGGL